MFIKSITIEGFRSYHLRNELKDLSEKHNVIIGGNGSGKSNIFNAIQFVLSDEFSHLSSTQRQQLIHENSGQTMGRVMTAFVEITLDNSDNRMPIDRNPIVVRRQIGFKKDQFFINGKLFLYSDIVNLLETAGFSRSNPYYIVKQGKINEMAISSDSYRLNVMREIAGTRVYDKKKKEAMKLLDDSQQRSQQIVDCLQTLNDKLETLETESENLKIFLKLDKKKRFLEYTIINSEIERAKNQITVYDNKQIETNDSIEEKRNKLLDLQEVSEDLQNQHKSIVKDIKESKGILKDINGCVDGLAKKKALIESKIKDFKEKSVYEKSFEEKTNNELKKLKESIASKRKSLNAIKANYESLKKKEKEVIQELKRKDRRRIELYEKQKRKEKFNSEEERNVWIQSELTKIDNEIETSRKLIAVRKAEMYSIESQVIKLEEEQKSNLKIEEQLIESIQSSTKIISDLKQNINDYETNRVKLWDKENEFRLKESKLIEEKLKIETNLSKICGKSSFVGRESIHKVLEMLKTRTVAEDKHSKEVIDGYYGQVIDCFTFDTNINNAIEVSAKGKLFYHIVKSDKIGSEMIKMINANKFAGEVTFIAIDKLKPTKPVNYPSVNNDAIPLTNLLKYEPKYDKVMHFLFDRILVCRNLEVCSSVARNSKLDCVTIDGDMVSSKGSMSGGHFGRISKIVVFSEWKSKVSELNELKSELRQIVVEKEENENLLSKEIQSLSSSDVQYLKNRRKIENSFSTKQSIKNNLFELKKKLESYERSINSLEETLPSMIANRDSFNSELKLALSSQLTDAENKELNKLLKDIEKLKTDKNDLIKKKLSYEKEMQSIESVLEENLEPRKNELELSLIEMKISDGESVIDSDNHENEKIKKEMIYFRNKFDATNNIINDYIKLELDLKQKIENAKLAEEKQLEIVNNEVKKQRKISVKYSNHQKKLDECNQKLRFFGTIPSVDQSEYRKMKLPEMYAKLCECNQELSDFQSVNKKSLDQFNEGKERSRLLSQEKEDIDIAYNSIQQLLESLEHQKYEAIQLTFRQVSKSFKDMFRKLVPEGKAFLDMVYADIHNESSAGSSQSSQPDSQTSGGITNIGSLSSLRQIDNFIGVKIRVAFNGTATIKELNQLSGGQKAIVALAFIFAIQKCDTAPFYLFDEVDQALDAQYRKTVSDVITELSQSSQFITTTFRPELLENADKFYGVKCLNRISHVEEISKTEALDFVSDDTQIGRK